MLFTTLVCLQGLSVSQAENWMRQLPEEKVPRLDSDGEKYRELQLVYQLPKQDLEERHCHHLGTSECRASFRDFAYARNDVALDVAVATEVQSALASVSSSSSGQNKCPKCSEDIAQGSLVVVAPRVSRWSKMGGTEKPL